MSAIQYATIQDAIRLIKEQTGNNVFMAKVDIESAFRVIQVSPLDRPLLGFQWKGKFFMDAALSMGSPALVRSLSISNQRWSSVTFRKYVRIA